MQKMQRKREGAKDAKKKRRSKRGGMIALLRSSFPVFSFSLFCERTVFAIDTAYGSYVPDKECLEEVKEERRERESGCTHIEEERKKKKNKREGRGKEQEEQERRKRGRMTFCYAMHLNGIPF